MSTLDDIKKLREKLKGLRGDWSDIAKDAGVSHSWLSKFCNGHIDNPGYVTVMRLQAELLDRKPAGKKAA